MNLRDVKHRILSVKSTQKITSSMKLVASAKLRKAQAAIESMRPYGHKLGHIMAELLSCAGESKTPFIVEREPKRVAIVAVASDTGLCGSFNANMIALMRETVASYRQKGIEVEIYTAGRKMHDAVKRDGFEPDTSLLEQAGAPVYGTVADVASRLMERFANGEIDRVDVVYPNFVTASSNVPTRETLLPVDITAMLSDETECECDYIMEPGSDELIAVLLPKTITLSLFTVLLSSAAAEHAARMIAMQLATDNADDLIAELTLEYNKGRQQAITNELLDITAGSAGTL